MQERVSIIDMCCVYDALSRDRDSKSLRVKDAIDKLENSLCLFAEGLMTWEVKPLMEKPDAPADTPPEQG